MDKLFVIDASGYLYRSYFAISNMTNAKGESTNALFGFLRSVMKLIKDFHPHHLVAVFDGPNNAQSRTAIYADYKAHRESMPGDLREQIEWARTCCQLMGISQLNIPGVEADDTMGSIAIWAQAIESEAFLCTSDKDLYQFVNDKIKILNTFKENLILGPKEVEDQFGVTPKQIVDFLAITGDSSDNIPGVPGFGPKTAAALLKQFDSLEALLAAVDTLPEKKKEILVKEGAKAVLSKKLVQIDTSLDIPKDVEFYRIKKPDIPALKEFYTRMGFHSLLRDLIAIEQNESPKEEAKQLQDSSSSYLLIDEETAFESFIEALQKQKEVTFCVETTVMHPMQASVVGISFCYDEKVSWYLPFNGHLAKVWGTEKLTTRLKSLFGNPKIAFCGHNIKNAYHALLNIGITIANPYFDTMLASYVLYSHSRQHSLDHLALEHLGRVKTTMEFLIGKGKHEIPIMDVAIDKLSCYCCEAVKDVYQLKQRFTDEIGKRQLDYIFYEIEMPLMPILAIMERHGIYLDVPYLQQMSVEIAHLIRTCEGEIHALAGEVFNINSPKQLSVILFEKLGIKAPKKTATGLSTNVDVLESLKDGYPIAGKLLEYRTMEKLRSTYIDSLPSQVNPKTHRIHCNFNQSVAATGRLSSQDPNLQNIPVRSEIGRKIRTGFRPEKKGWSYLSADYSQIELRLLAHLSEDPELIRAFTNNEDIHAHTAATVLNIPLNQVTKEQRHQAKAVNFGIVYGQQAYGLSQGLGIDIKEAGAFIDAYFAKFKRVKEYIEASKVKARETGKAVTLTGRERLIPEINSKNGMLRSAAERLAINTPLQGMAADLIKLAMVEVNRQLEKNQKLSYLILQIHDELLFEVPDFELIDVEVTIRKVMEGVWKLKVPLVIDISIGKNWEEC